MNKTLSALLILFLIVFYGAPSHGQPQPVRISETTWKGQPHFKVENLHATWYIEKMSGGCSSLIDQYGQDWINFKKTGTDGPLMSSDSDYRGLPNLVFKEADNGVGHPGFDKCTSTLISPNEILVRSTSGLWQFRWLFYPDFVEIKVEKTDNKRKYWFLFEGPVAGMFQPHEQYWGTDKDGLRTDRPSIYSDPQQGNWQWAFFGMNRSKTSFFVAQKEKDELPDFFAYMGNDPKKQNSSSDGMNVFGFGRDLKTNPRLSGELHFYIGIFPHPLNQEKHRKAFEKFISLMVDSR